MARFLRYPDLRLGRAATPRLVDEAMIEVGEKLMAAAMEVQAYGLAAAHLGQVEPLIVISIAPDARSRDYRILFNPEIVFASEDAETGLEGSVSMPGVDVPNVRANSVELVYDDAERVRHKLRLEGFAARVAQHEVDQINGIFLLDRLSRLKRDIAMRRYNKAGAR